MSTRKSKLDTAFDSTTPSATSYHNLRSSSGTQQSANKISLRSSAQCDSLINNTSLGAQLMTSPYVSMPFFTFTPSMSIQTTNSNSAHPQLISSTTIANPHAAIGGQPPVSTSALNQAPQQTPPPHQLIATGTLQQAALTSPIYSSNSPGSLQTTPNSCARTRGFKLSSAAAKTSSFFASLHPSRWGKWSNGTNGAGGGQPPTNSQSPLLDSSTASNSRIYHRSSNASILSNEFNGQNGMSPRNFANGNRDKIKKWIKEQARLFVEKYFSSDADETDGPESKVSKQQATNTLKKLKQAIDQLENKQYLKSLKSLKNILIEGDLSSFELINSGLIQKLTVFLTATGDKGELEREKRICIFLNVFIKSPLNPNEITPIILGEIDAQPFSTLIAKLNACVSHLEQFPVRVHDIMPNSSASGNIRGTSALKFFHTHQLKCNLQRHKDCKNLKQWRGGAVKIDPLAMVSAIERYLVVRGYGRIRESGDGDVSEDDNSDEDFDDNMAAMISQGQGRHKLQFMYGEHVLPYNMTVYQAIRQFSSAYSSFSANGDLHNGEIEQDADLMSLWNQTHTIFYRPYPEQPSSQQSASSGSSTGQQANATSSSQAANATASSGNGSNHSSGSKKSAKSSSGKTVNNILHKRKDELWLEGKIPKQQNSILECFTNRLPIMDTIQDQSLEVINLLRVLHGVNSYWGHFYGLPYAYNVAIPQSEFVNSKLTAKANRQLQDPLMIMTGNFPLWLSQLAYCCPFLFPFECRHLLFYVTSFDRDRALQRLLDSTQGLNSNDSSERVTPRIEKRKRVITREDILKQSEGLLNDVGNSKSLLEIRYENEVGTGKQMFLIICSLAKLS